MYETFLSDLRSRYQADRILDGQVSRAVAVGLGISDRKSLTYITPRDCQFGAMMDVALVNDGPATIVLDSATDAPARPPSKNDAKAKRREEAERLAAEKQKRRQQAASENQQRATAEPGTTEPATENGKDDKQGRNLAERFKEAMTESY